MFDSVLLAQEAEHPHEKCRRAVVKPCSLMAIRTEGLYFEVCHHSKGSVTLGNAQHLTLSQIPSALFWVHGDFNRCRNLLLPLTWGRRSFPA